jgi:hypothetical protein
MTPLGNPLNPLGWDPDEAEACADDVYDGALNEDERAATQCIDNEEDYRCTCSWVRTTTS